jgi:hypothetical protein
MPSPLRGFTITFIHTTLGRTPLDEWSTWRRDLYLTTHSTHKRQTSMPPAVFKPTIPASERPQTYALYREATEIGVPGNCLVLLSLPACLWYYAHVTYCATNRSSSWYRVALSFQPTRDLRNSADWWCVQGWSVERERCDIISRSSGDTLGPDSTGEKGEPSTVHSWCNGSDHDQKWIMAAEGTFSLPLGSSKERGGRESYGRREKQSSLQHLTATLSAPLVLPLR